jgi:hypothetical protein
MRHPVPLDPNRTYTYRKANLILASEPGFPVVGVLWVSEQKSRSTPPDLSRYAVVELRFDRGRRFRLAKTDGSFYFVYLPAEPSNDGCDCTGFSQYGRCKHTEALRAVERAGGLPWVADYPALTPNA